MQVGDQVKLKSGGPIMTIDENSTSDTRRWNCVWWNSTKSEFESRYFRETTLEVVTP